MITLCSMPVKIPLTMISIIGFLNIGLRLVRTLVLEEIDPIARSQVLNKISMLTTSHSIGVSYPFSDTEDRSLNSHIVKLNDDLRSIGLALSMY